LDCEWQTESYKNAQAIAAKHAKDYGHRVEGELGIAFLYDYRDEGPSINSKSKRTLNSKQTITPSQSWGLGKSRSGMKASGSSPVNQVGKAPRKS